VALGSLLSALVVRGVGRRVTRWEPRTRHRALVLLAALPLPHRRGAHALATLPSLLSLELPGFRPLQRCTTTHIRTSAFVHLPSMGVNAGALFVLLVFLGYAALRASFAIVRVVRALRVLRGLGMSGENARRSRCDHHRDVAATLPDGRLLAAACGCCRAACSARSPTRIARSSSRTNGRTCGGGTR